MCNLLQFIIYMCALQLTTVFSYYYSKDSFSQNYTELFGVQNVSDAAFYKNYSSLDYFVFGPETWHLFAQYDSLTVSPI